METITTISTGNGKLYITKRDKARIVAMGRRLESYERALVKKYGKHFNLLITKAEYNKAMKLHNELFHLTEKVKRNQKSLKQQLKKK